MAAEEPLETVDVAEWLPMIGLGLLLLLAFWTVSRGAVAVEAPADATRRVLVIKIPGAVAQLGERRVCNAEVAGSSPVGSSRRNAGA